MKRNLSPRSFIKDLWTSREWGPARSSDPERDFQAEIEVKLEDYSEPETEDCDDWLETREYQSVINEMGSAADIHSQACSTVGLPPLSPSVCFETTMHHSIVPFGTEPAFEQCKTCCRLFHCPMCPKFKPARRKKLEMHLKVHLKNAVTFQDKRICRCNLNCRDAGHFHCPMCDKTIIKKRDFEVHLDFCQTALQKTLASVAPQSELNSDPGLPAPTPVALTMFTHGSSSPAQQSLKCPESTVSPSPETAASPPQQHAISSSVVSTQENERPVLLYKRVKCPHCKLILYKKNVIKHIQRRHEVHSKKMKAHDDLKGVCVDATNGISAVQKDILGSSEPIHVQMKTWGHVHKVQCEMEECRQFHLMAVRSGLTLRHCEHIRSLDHCTVIAHEEFLQGEVLSEMVALKVFNEAAKAACLKRQRKAQASHVPLCVPISFQENQKRFYFSIHEPTVNHYSRLGRVMVTYTLEDNTWHCPCAKPRISCVHKNISKWHLFQTKQDMFEMETASAGAPQEHQGPAYPPMDEDLRRLVQYIYKHKKLPAKLPDDLVKPKALINYLTELQPTETFCAICPGCVLLEKPARITKKAKIITMSGVIKNVSTYFRSCPKCHMVYRYQEWKDGLHNFDDHILLNLDLCLYLRHNLQNNVSVSQVMSSLESLRKVEFPSPETILHAYCHFEALTSHEYSFSCVCCGYYPPVVMMDQHKKGVSHSPVNDEIKSSENFTGEVNVEEFWDSVQMEMISRGFFPSQAKNPFALNPCSEHWGPWIGRNTRKSEVVFNTESEKVSKFSTEAEVSMVSEEFCVDELMKQKASPERNLHKVFILDTKRSSGGWSVIQCPHGVVYSLKFSSRLDPPRDFADLLLSWKHLPNVSLCDFALDLATHVNLRSPSSLPFKPHDGRLAASTEENITAAQKRKLRISLPWLNKMSKNPDEDGHPLTGSSDHYALYGKFNKANTKDPQEVLRGTSLVPELQSSLNREAAKGLLSSMHKNSYFLNSMAPSTHIFMMRNLVHLRNNDTNAKLLEEVLQSGDVAHRLQDITLNDFGQAVLGTYDIKEIDFVFS
ncbi:uncharacterized protein LOC121523528 isoform X2 [Cheilinus undulatus]|uniref:uncharacterized protein LOC121523528 isoform X2 n=1 Tax=Cheilinus undulatus TaxID=241271 RepID=UPI001BD64004|nr:uncharacterized protein LOC121523528 isoform X2 [Cheilinus undulatus]